jgi:hypothetical protein
MRVLLSRLFALLVACVAPAALRADILESPNANQIQGPFYVQPFSFVTVDSVSGGAGQTSDFFSVLPPDAFPTTTVVNILGNFEAFDSMGNPVTDFDITGVSVTTGGSTFAPAFGTFNFVGNPSMTYTDALNPLNTTTFLASDFTLAFTFMSDPSFVYSYSVNVTGLDAGSFLTFDDAEGTVPEPASIWLLAAVLGSLYGIRRRWPRVYGLARNHQ